MHSPGSNLCQLWASGNIDRLFDLQHIHVEAGTVWPAILGHLGAGRTDFGGMLRAGVRKMGMTLVRIIKVGWIGDKSIRFEAAIFEPVGFELWYWLEVLKR